MQIVDFMPWGLELETGYSFEYRPRFERKEKLSPRYIRPFDIVHTIGEVAYKLALPPDFAIVYSIFHVSMLHLYIRDPSHVRRWDSVQLDEQLTFVEDPMLILAYYVRRLCIGRFL